jgi:2-polyprenylphenol hydroxylase and related flavodoxin oxidoreductases
MAPILSLLRSMAERGLQRKATFFYGARTKKDLCFEPELRRLEQMLPGFRTYRLCPSRLTTRNGMARPA